MATVIISFLLISSSLGLFSPPVSYVITSLSGKTLCVKDVALHQVDRLIRLKCYCRSIPMRFKCLRQGDRGLGH